MLVSRGRADRGVVWNASMRAVEWLEEIAIHRKKA